MAARGVDAGASDSGGFGGLKPFDRSRSDDGDGVVEIVFVQVTDKGGELAGVRGRRLFTHRGEGEEIIAARFEQRFELFCAPSNASFNPSIVSSIASRNSNEKNSSIFISTYARASFTASTHLA